MYVSELCVHVPFQALFLRQVSRVIFRARSRVNFLIFRHRQNNNNNTTNYEGYVQCIIPRFTKVGCHLNKIIIKKA